MLDEHYCRGPRGTQSRETGEERRGAGGIEVRRRLVEDEYPRLGSKHAGEGKPLLLSAGQSRRPMKLETAQTDLGQGLRHSGDHPVTRPAPVLEAKGNVVRNPFHHELGGGVLEDDPDSTRERGGFDRPDLRCVEPERPGKGARDLTRHEPGDRQGERALAGPGRSNDQQAGTGCELERDVAKSGPLRPGGVGERQIAGRQGPDRAAARCVPGGRVSAFDLDRAGGPSRQAGNPSRTPARRSDRTMRTDPKATMTTAEIPIIAPRTS